jgi:chemotaxis methyl-accepting protein methylase
MPEVAVDRLSDGAAREGPGYPHDAAAVASRFRHLVFAGDRPVTVQAKPSGSSHTLEQKKPRAAHLDVQSAAFFNDLLSRGGLRAGRYRESILLRRRHACLRALRVSSTEEATRVIGGDTASADRALGAVMIGVTRFFRDLAIFQSLRGLLSPLHRARGRLDALSVGCSDGSELYSLAMQLAEEGLLTTSRLWGLDCRTDAIAAATAGVYPAGCIESIPPAMRDRYLIPAHGVAALGRAGRRTVPLRRFAGCAPGAVRVADALRAACSWMVADVFQPPKTPGEVDLILCRNLAIYLNTESAAELWMLLASRLRPGGLLIVGKAERPSSTLCDKLVRVESCVYRKGPDIP